MRYNLIKHLYAISLSIVLTVACQNAVGSVERPFFYKIMFNGKSSFILGTHHIDVSAQELPAYIANALKKSRLLLAELILSKSEISLWKADFVSAIINETAKYPKNPRSQALTPEEKNILRNQWELPTRLIEIATSTSCGAYQALAYPAPQLDSEIEEIAYAEQIPMLPLDTMALRQEADEADLKIFPDCELRIMLKSLTREQILKEIAQSDDDYRKGDESSIEGSTSPGLKIRNSAWMPKILSEIENGNVFIAIGVSHLYGDAGIISLLKKYGATVNRVQ